MLGRSWTRDGGEEAGNEKPTTDKVRGKGLEPEAAYTSQGVDESSRVCASLGGAGADRYMGVVTRSNRS